MRIAIFTDAFLPQINGVVTYITETAQKLVERGHEVLVFAPKPRKGVKINLSEFSFKIFLLPSLPAFVYPDARITLPALPKLLIDLKKFRTEIIHIQTPFTVGTEGLISGKILKIPLVATFHSFYIDKPFFEDFKLEKFSDQLQNPLWNLYTSYFNLVDTVICPTRIAQTELKKYGLYKPNVVIQHGVNFFLINKGIKADISNLQRKLGLKSADKVGIYSGRLAADKGIDTLINIWRKVVNNIPDAKLLIIGSGPIENSLKNLVKKFKLRKEIIFSGAINRDTLMEKGWLKLGRLAVSASKIENMSYSLLEEMAFGLPAVAYKIRGIPEILDNDCGILVPPDDTDSFAEKIVDLFSDGAKLKKLSRGAKNKAKLFDLEKKIDALENLYSDMINSKSRIKI